MGHSYRVNTCNIVSWFGGVRMTTTFLTLMILSVIFSENKYYKKYAFNMTLVFGILSLVAKIYETAGGI